MANASYIQDSFSGGEKSQLAQGRITDREYRTWMNVCLNGHPTEYGAWVRRPGTMFAGTTRGGQIAKVVKFDFQVSTSFASLQPIAAYTLEFTASFLRFRVGQRWATTNDAVSVASISAANPAVVNTAAPVTWATSNTVTFSGLGSNAPLLQNRQFIITVIDSTHFSLADALTGATIDGSTLGAIGATATVARIQEIATPYVKQHWDDLRIIQAEANAVTLDVKIPPQLLTVTTLPNATIDAQFSLAGITFLDGPYLDPFTNGVQAVPGGTSGNITLTLAFPTFSATQAYQTGQFVTSAAINYQSLIDNNVGNTPASSPSAWAAVSAGLAINGGQGFLATDVGRLVRLFSEPALWSATTTYAVGNIVAYNPSGQPGASTYWTSLVASNTGNIPGNDVTHWQLTPANAANWTWGKITSLGNQISQTLPGGVNIGTMTQNGGLAASFDGVPSKGSNACSALAGVGPTVAGYVGKNFSGASAQKIGQGILIPSNNSGFAVDTNRPNIAAPLTSVTVNLRAKQTAPAASSDGTLLGTSGAIQNSTAPVVITSNDQTTAWNYVWFELIGLFSRSDFAGTETIYSAQAEFFSPSSSGSSGNTINVEILGPPLLNTAPIISWRLGVYSNTTGYPSTGTYHEGRIWLGGALPNRFDASVSNGLVGTTLNFAPTDQNGVVGGANAISAVLNSDSVNPIRWMVPDLQGVIMGTQTGEFLIFGPSSGPITPTNISARRVTHIGTATNVEPKRTELTTVFVQRYSRKVMEYFSDVFSGKFTAPTLSKDAMHITKPGVVELAYQQAVVPIIWGRNADGSWWGTTYRRDTLTTSQGPTLNGWHRHQLGSGRTLASITVGPSIGGNLDALTMVTLDPATNVYHVEILTDAVDEGETLIQASYVDDAINPTSTSTTNASSPGAPYGGLTINGLWHLNGKTVTAWLGGLDCGDYAVANGSIFVPYGDGVSAGTAAGLFTAIYANGLTLAQMLVGFTFTSQGQIVRPALQAESGARNGPAVGKVRRNHKIAAQFEGTGLGVTFGTTFAKMDPAKFRQLNGVPLTVNQQFTGVYKETLTDNLSFDGMICWQQTRPYPLNIANLGGFIETTDE